MLNGICELDNIDRGGTMVLAQSEGPFSFSVSCPYRTRAVGLIHWCKYNGVCEMRNTEVELEIKEAAKYSSFWKVKR